MANKLLAMSVPTMVSVPVNALINAGLKTTSNIHYQLSPDELAIQTVALNQGQLCDTGALVINTGEFSGRSIEMANSSGDNW